MLIITLQNTTKQMRVYQLDQRVAAGEYKGRSETVHRIDHDKNGNASPRRVRLRHGPVLRLLAGEVREVPAAILHDPHLRRDTRGNRPPVKIVRRETPGENAKRKEEEATDEASRVAAREAAAARQAKHTEQQGAKKTAPSTTTVTEEKAGSKGGTKRGRSTRRSSN